MPKPEPDLSISTIIQQNTERILTEWIAQLESIGTDRNTQGREAEIRGQTREILDGLQKVLAAGVDDRSSVGAEINASAWRPVRDIIDNLTKMRTRQGKSATETALFIFALKEVIFQVFRDAYASDPLKMASSVLYISQILDRLGIYTTEIFQRTREEIISRQQQELLELSTPVVKLWDEVLALPLIGTLDSARTQVVMENLLQEIVSTGAAIAIIDITGVPTVDTLVAQHLLKTVAAARLMGADCIISGIRPQIAQTIVHLGVELNDVTTKATLADAFALALTRTGKVVKRISNLAATQSGQRNEKGNLRMTDHPQTGSIG